ncbi:MAG: glycerol-3-phosphate 1-O-acyltransferase PlsY [Alphaproteobacteria bacterium]|jgi:glycerol-3-phosphate acyltransferase PlsY
MEGASPLLYYWHLVQAVLGMPDWKLVVYGWQTFLLVAIVAYLVGAVPWGLLLTAMAGKGDIRQIGSGNIGATNVLRTGSKGLAALTLLLDAGKGAAVVLACRHLLGPDVTYVAAIVVVLGHLFPVWLKFRGGKGVATTLGVLLVLSWPVGLATISTWLAVGFITRYSSLAALVALALAPVYGWVIAEPRIGGLALILALLAWFKHAGNIRRLLAGTETKIRLRRG